MSQKSILMVFLALILTLSLATGALAMGMGGGGGMAGGMMSAVGSMMSGSRGNMNNQGNMDPNQMNQQNQGNMSRHAHEQPGPGALRHLGSQWQYGQYGKWQYGPRQRWIRERHLLNREHEAQMD